VILEKQVIKKIEGMDDMSAGISCYRPKSAASIQVEGAGHMKSWDSGAAPRECSVREGVSCQH
jgi:hypothetical protein